MDNENLENPDWKTFDILQYVKENLSGLFLLALAFFIIYFVDYINRLNTIIYSSPTPVLNLPPNLYNKKKFKKR